MELSHWLISALWRFIGQDNHMRLFNVLTFVIAALPTFALGAVLQVVGPANMESGASETLSVILVSDENINAFEGVIKIDPLAATIERVRNANSLVSFWIESPETDESGAVRFSGIVPGGEMGPLPLFVIDIKNISFDAGSVTGTAAVFAHDGKGTKESAAVMYVVSDISVPVSSQEDTTPPDSLILLIERDKNLFDGDATLIFSAQDDTSGIAYYEVQEHDARVPEPEGWERAESPHRLLRQSRSGYVSVKAVDYAGNVRIETVSLTSAFVSKVVPIIALLILLFVLWYVHKKRSTVA